MNMTGRRSKDEDKTRNRRTPRSCDHDHHLGYYFVSTKVLLEDFPPVDILFTVSHRVDCADHGASACADFPELEARSAVCGSRFMRSDALLSVGNIALTLTYASNAGMIVAVIPMITAVLAHFLLSGEKLEPRFSLGSPPLSLDLRSFL
ncbi:hypothetical protein PO124_12040 [Bacillus licheniformis]|nr:hypothetical protein [Bacillus licheniformis]